MVILFQPANLNLRYNVKFETYNKDSKVTHNTLAYVCDIFYKKETFKGYLINFKKFNIILNNSKIHEPMNEIALISGELLNDLDLEISVYGEILKIKNLKAIHKAWEKIKFKIEYTYQGDFVKKIIEEIDKNVMDEKRFIESLYKDPFFFNLFSNLYRNYPNNRLIYDSSLSNFAGIKTIEIKKESTAEKINESEQIVRGEGCLKKETKKILLEEKGLKNIGLLFTTTHRMASPGYVTQMDLRQEFIVDGQLVASQKMNVISENKEK